MAKQEQSCPAFRTSIGGQALIEGILMRGPEKQAIVVRSAEGIVSKVEDLHPLREEYKWAGWPLIRGVVSFVDSMANGMKALTYSASFLPEEEQEEPSKLDKWVEEKFGSEKAEKFVIGVAMVLGLALAVGLFVFLPTLLVGLIPALRTGHDSLRTLLEGVVKLAIFLFYMYGVSRMKDMRRLFSYHGAEHKTIFCYEQGLELTVENVRKQSKHHPRCGTSFMLVVIITAIIINTIIFALFPVGNVFLRMLIQLALLPLVVGITYEFNRYVGGHDNPFTNFLAKPGLWMQNFTTFEPDDGMIEVAITAMKLVIPEEKGKDAW